MKGISHLYSACFCISPGGAEKMMMVAKFGKNQRLLQIGAEVKFSRNYLICSIAIATLAAITSYYVDVKDTSFLHAVEMSATLSSFVASGFFAYAAGRFTNFVNGNPNIPGLIAVRKVNVK